jgi:LysM repeat protein
MTRAQKKADGFALLASAAPQAAEQSKVHVVKSGESLSVIAGKYRVELTQLCQANNLTSADMIYVGQRLWIP